MSAPSLSSNVSKPEAPEIGLDPTSEREWDELRLLGSRICLLHPRQHRGLLVAAAAVVLLEPKGHLADPVRRRRRAESIADHAADLLRR